MMEELLGILGMLLTVCCVLVLAYLATRYLAGRGMQGPRMGRGGGALKVLDQLALGREQRLVLVQAGERFLLLGISPADISQLAEFSQDEAQQWLDRLAQTSAQGPTTNFTQALKQSLERIKPKRGSDGDGRTD